MIVSFNTVLAEAPSWPADNSARLIKRQNSLPITPDLEAEQSQEVRRRINDVLTGHVSTIPGEQVFTEIQQSLARRRSA
ncbi:MAG: addiction module protein [Verrucomicrobia bacterium]|nr:addiction module protein [Verrucomicrobiota bacterium]